MKIKDCTRHFHCLDCVFEEFFCNYFRWSGDFFAFIENAFFYRFFSKMTSFFLHFVFFAGLWLALVEKIISFGMAWTEQSKEIKEYVFILYDSINWTDFFFCSFLCCYFIWFFYKHLYFYSLSNLVKICFFFHYSLFLLIYSQFSHHFVQFLIWDKNM